MALTKRGQEVFEKTMEVTEFTRKNREFICSANVDFRNNRIKDNCIEDYCRALRELDEACDIIDQLISFAKVNSAKGELRMKKTEEELSASEALYGFCGWLTTRSEKVIMSASDDCSPIVELIKRFCCENKLTEPQGGWEKKLTHPRVIKVL